MEDTQFISSTRPSTTDSWLDIVSQWIRYNIITHTAEMPIQHVVLLMRRQLEHWNGFDSTADKKRYLLEKELSNLFPTCTVHVLLNAPQSKKVLEEIPETEQVFYGFLDSFDDNQDTLHPALTHPNLRIPKTASRKYLIAANTSSKYLGQYGMCTVKKVDLCVVGAGISGLSLAAFASERLTVCVLKKKSVVGGLLQSHQLGDSLFDEAANGWLDSEPSVEQLIQLVNATSLVTPANTNKSTRYLVHRGLHALSPKLLLHSTPLLSWWQKIRAARELFWSPKPKGEPSMAEFMSGRFGSAIIDNFLAPMCAGIYADAPEKMSVRAAFPNLWKMATQGSILRQLIARLKDKKRKRPTLHQ